LWWLSAWSIRPDRLEDLTLYELRSMAAAAERAEKEND
jgi:hypothetical protein